MFLRTCNSIITGPFVHLHPIGAVVTKPKTKNPTCFHPIPKCARHDSSIHSIHPSNIYSHSYRITRQAKQQELEWNGDGRAVLLRVVETFYISTNSNVRASIIMEIQAEVLFNSLVERHTINYILSSYPMQYNHFVYIDYLFTVYIHISFIYHSKHLLY